MKAWRPQLGESITGVVKASDNLLAISVRPYGITPTKTTAQGALCPIDRHTAPLWVNCAAEILAGIHGAFYYNSKDVGTNAHTAEGDNTVWRAHDDQHMESKLSNDGIQGIDAHIRKLEVILLQPAVKVLFTQSSLSEYLMPLGTCRPIFTHVWEG